MMKAGQKVRLNEFGLRAFLATGGSPRRHRAVHWEHRVGVISRITMHKQAMVIWDGNKTPSDAVSLTVLETVR